MPLTRRVHGQSRRDMVCPGPSRSIRVLADGIYRGVQYALCDRHVQQRVWPCRSAGVEAFLDRTIPKTGIGDAGNAYAHLLKYGLSRNYWSEYVLEAYVNHRHDMIMLAGFPDVPSSRPHARGNKL